MTPAVHDYVARVGAGGKALDVGSLDVNGSVRSLFPEYVGVDMRAGKNVDIVASSHDLPFDDETFDTVTCLEMLEHDSQPFATFFELARVVKEGGTVIVTTRGINFPRHDYPSDYWRFTGEGLRLLFEGAGLTVKDITEDAVDKGVFGYGVK